VEVASKLGDDVLRKHGIFCGARLPPLITSEGNFMRITFTSDNRFYFMSFIFLVFSLRILDSSYIIEKDTASKNITFIMFRSMSLFVSHQNFIRAIDEIIS